MFVRNCLAASITLTLAGVVAQPTPLFAQNGEEAETLETVEVLGSRIRRAEQETWQPVTSIDRADLERTGLTSVADVLREISANGPSLSLQTNNGNTSGNSSVNLRNCASNRTLVLVNGKRWVSNNGLAGTVDLGSIPLAAVDRIDILKDGASALYGSDALCGVINLQTRTGFEGMVVDAYYGQYDESDGDREAISVTMGGSSADDKFSGMLTASFVDQKPVFAGDREISAVPLFGFPANTSSPGRASPVGPFGNFTLSGRNFTLDPSRPGCRPNQVCAPGTQSDFRNFNFITDGYNFAPENYLLQPQKTYSVFATGDYAISDSIRAKAEVFYTNRNGDAQLAAQPLSPLTISAQSIYNPFGANITGAAFRPINFPRIFGQDQDTWRFTTGLEGSFEFGDRYFYWDVGYNYADNKQVQVKDGFYFTTRVNNATGPSFIDTQGIPRCGTPTAVIAGCVPMNVMGGAAGFTQAMFDNVAVSPRNLQQSSMTSITANLSGEVIDLPAGPLAFAFGLERRKEEGSDNPDPLTNAGLVLGDNPVTPTRGAFDVNEAYLELSAPLLSDAPLAKSLEVSLAARYSDFSSFGSTTTPKFSVRWQVIDELLIRGSWGEGFRAPSVAELFQGNATGRPAFQDLCSSSNPLFVANASTRQRCAETGVPAGFVSRLSQTFLTTGGNSDLQPEESVSKTLGVVYSPEWMEGLDLYADWYSIEIENSIGGFGANAILTGCYSQLNDARCALITRDRTGAVNGNPGEISNIDSRNLNFLGGLETDGLDFGGSYRFEIGDWGTLTTRFDNTYVNYFGDIDKPERGELNRDGDISGGNLVGTLPAGSSAGAPRHRLRSNLSLVWSIEDFTVSTTLEYRSRINESCNNVVNTANALGAVDANFRALRDLCSDPDRVIDLYSFVPGTSTVRATPGPSPRNSLGGTTYTHLQGSWKSPWDATVTLGVRNLFEKDPPFSSDAFANSYDAQYLIPGRFFYMNYIQRF